MYYFIPVHTEDNYGEKNEVMHILQVETNYISLAKSNYIGLVFS